MNTLPETTPSSNASLSYYARHLKPPPHQSTIQWLTQWRKRRRGYLLDRVIRANVPLVIEMLKAYSISSEGSTYEDCLSEGIQGLIEAAQTFKPELGYQFSTWAKYRVNLRIEQFLCTERAGVSVSRGFFSLMGRGAKAVRHLEQKLGRTVEEKDLIDHGWRPTEARYFMNFYSGTVSLDALNGSAESFLVENGWGGTPIDEERLFQERDYHLLYKAIDSLPDPLDRKLVKAYFGLNGKARKGLREHSHENGVSKQASSQRLQRIFEKLRHSPDLAPLKEAYLSMG